MKCLLLIDLQNDFLPGGALAVPNGHEVLAPANAIQRSFPLIVATQDWPPANHGSFAANHPGKRPGDIIDLNGLKQILWPIHCVQNSPGAALANSLDRSRIDRIFQKGSDPTIDSYSGFFDNGHRRSTGLADYLKSKRVTDVYIAGLATDYCVKFTALDARQLGFKTTVIQDACRGVELTPGDTARALDEMRNAAVNVIELNDLPH